MKQHYAIRLTTVSMVGALTLFGEYPKRYTERIAIAGADRYAEITGEAAHVQFRMGGGPGFSTNGVPQVTGWIVADWLTSLPEPAATVTRYVVTFHVTCFKGTPREHREQYVVYYAFDPGANRGYIRLPARGEAYYAKNVRMVSRGDAFEGPWFAAAPSWTAGAEAALKASPAQPRR